MTVALVIVLTLALIIQSVRAHMLQQQIQSALYTELIRVRADAADADRQMFETERNALIQMGERMLRRAHPDLD